MDRTDLNSIELEPTNLSPPAKYLPFLSGKYTVAPGLSQLGDGKAFLLDTEYESTISLKAKLLAEAFVKHVRFADFPAELERAVAIHMASRLAVEWPQRFNFDGNALRCRDEQMCVDHSGAFDAICRVIQEDVVVIRVVGSRDFNCAIHLCFANGWSPAEKIGQSLFETHAPVPGIAAMNSRAHEWAKMMVNAVAPLVRFVWGIRFDDWLDHHPQSASLAFHSANPKVFVRVERQTIMGLPEQKASIFLIRTFLYDATSLSVEERHALANAIEGMSEAAAAYKGLSQDRISIIQLLRCDGRPTA